MKKCKHVVIFGLDALGGIYMRQASTPIIDRILADGAITYRALCAPCTGSPEGWGSILTGTSPKCHGIYYPVMENDRTRLQPTIFSHVRQAFPDAVLGSFCEWGALNDMMLEDDIGIYKQNVFGEELVENVSNFLVSEKPTLLYIHLDIPDDCGHTYGFGTIPYYDGIARCDAYVGKMFAAAEKAGMTKENTLFIVTGDHGGAAYTHGGMDDLEKYVFLGVAGCGVENIQMGDVNIRDAAAIVLHALGIPLPAYNENGWTGQIPPGLFDDGSGEHYKPVVRLHRNFPEDLPKDKTPVDFYSERGLGGLFGEKAPILALMFDGAIMDSTGHFTPAHCYRDGAPVASRKYGGKGIRHVKGGVRGNCVLCDWDGYLSIPELRPGSNSFSVAFWIDLEHSGHIQHSADTIFSNKNYADNESDGFCLSVGDSIVRFYMNSGDASANFGRNATSIKVGSHTLPEEFDGGWIHFIACVDRERQIYRLFLGFKEIGSEQIPKTFEGKCLDGCGTLRIGYELSDSEICANTNQYMLDDFLWFDRALDERDIEILRNYYL